MMRLYERADRLSALLRRSLLAVVTSEGLYLALMVLFNGVLGTDVFMTSNHLIQPIQEYVMMPWSGALLGVYLAREKRNSGLDIWALALLELWLIVPFVFRFGTEYFIVSAAFNYALCFFVLYASVRQSDAARRAHQLDAACAGICLLSIALGGALLYCAATGKVFFSYADTEHFGVVNGQLQHATHYNGTAMLALVCTMMCLAGFCRSIKKPYAIIYLLGVVIMALVVVLTQSRTARYALLGAFAVGAWNALAAYLPIKKWWLRQAAAIACAALVFVGGFKLSGQITDAALRHYAGQPSAVAEAIVPSALAEEAQAVKPMEARSQVIDSTFSDRTNIWKNAINYWKSNPKYMLIGNGASRTQWLIHKGTIHEARGSIAMHNAYLHFAAEFGLIGFGVLAAFMLIILPSVLHVFFASRERRMPGGCALCMLVLVILATGMMESAPLEVMTPMIMALFFALGQLAGAGRDMKETK
ncbi:MAG: O-antigen ligase family protein [Clostridia bacterium]|nr:O-antigen ligase family protein [Clostridia bacterium]